MEEARIDVSTIHGFSDIELMGDQVSDETKILTFHHVLEMNGLAEEILTP